MEKEKNTFEQSLIKRAVSKENLKKIKDGIDKLFRRAMEDLIEENKRLKIKLAKYEKIEKFSALDYLLGKDIPS